MLCAPYRIFFLPYCTVLHKVRLTYFLLSFLCKLWVTQGRGFLQLGLVEGLALMALILLVPSTCLFLLERSRAFSPNPFLLWLHPALTLPIFRELKLSRGHDQLEHSHALQHMQGRQKTE